MLIIIPLLFGILLYAIIRGGVRSGGYAMSRKFRDLGDVVGKTVPEITAAVGSPVSVAQVGNGKTLYQWASPGYRVGLLFEDDKCLGITSEYAAQ